ncbi:hypothetical protein A4X13_0g8073 [Tilletia indica]|uniref:Uncharacterized protein n=1 Tax=Tilletia indica TaxID=43049 RepID=A0A177T492_9BASI|nr:hypothetical protein A4X13_0g8073 [Tilletia indica]
MHINALNSGAYTCMANIEDSNGTWNTHLALVKIAFVTVLPLFLSTDLSTSTHPVTTKYQQSYIHRRRVAWRRGEQTNWAEPRR